MARTIKHSKIKNTGIIFELLTRQITVDILNNKSSKAVKLLKNYFHESKELGKELNLYKVLSSKTKLSEIRANHLVDAVLKSRGNLSNKKIKTEKYNLIKEIKDNYGDDFFNAKIPNFKLNASIYKLFLSESSGFEFNPEDAVQSRYTIVENLNKEHKKVVEKKNPFTKEEKDLRLLAYNILVEKFNKKYKNLSADQKKLLKEYINNLSNSNNLREYINEEYKKVHKVLKELIKGVDNKVTKIKLRETIKKLTPIKSSMTIKDNQVVSLMRFYELIKEIRRVQTKN
jgi:hypothetical protein|tara:strand:+ start:237 stop:1094 length:858 start_codon:yes stop_codon:yes gene_type:complete